MAKKDPIYCPICGEKLTQREEGGRLRPACDNCGYIHFVNPVPGVGLLIEMDDGVVLIQRGHPPHKGEWTLPSGFVEEDESAEEAAIREAEEETGLKVDIIELMGINSFPEGPPVSGIMIFYRMKPVGGTLQAGDDAADVKVFQPEDMPLLPFRTHREIMAEWLDMHGKPDAHTKRAAPEFIIRMAREHDIDEIYALLATIPANRDLSDQDWLAVKLRILETATTEVFVAEATGTGVILGCLALSVARGLTESFGIINDMAVLPTYQRRGVGAELLESVMRRATALNLDSILVNTQRGNDQARAFYAALGFSEMTMMHLKIR